MRPRRSPAGRPTHGVSLRVPAEVLAAVKENCQRFNVTQNNLIVTILEHALTGVPGEPLLPWWDEWSQRQAAEQAKLVEGEAMG